MALFITVAQLKGGAGKSTVATNLAGCLSREFRTGLIDADLPQGTASRWAALRADPALSVAVCDSAGQLALEAEKMDDSCDVVVIDMPPRSLKFLREALAFSDLVLMPLSSSPADVWAAEQLVDMVREARKTSKRLTARLLWNRVRSPQTVREQLASAGLRAKVMHAAIGSRVAYAEALDCPHIHVLAGIVPPGVERESLKDLCAGNLRWAAAEMFLGSNPAAFMYMSGPGFAAILDRIGNADQKRWAELMIDKEWGATMVLTEPDAGSDATGMRTSFREEGDHLVVNGSKTFITNGDVADLYLVFGKWAGVDDPRKAISCLVIEKGTPGLSVARLEDKLGHRASSTATLNFDNCRVDKRNLICGPGDGLPMLLASLNRSRPSIGAHSLGIAHAAFEDAVAYINGRRQSGKRVIEFQGVQFLLADLASELALCDAWLLYVARLVDEGVKDMGIEASILKMRASDLAMRMATEAIQLHGGYGYCKEYRVERLFRDAKIGQIWEGTNQIHRQIIGRSFIER